jgi:threonylcarbamoyladenosine tRNA methylthiotransferase MtaB
VYVINTCTVTSQSDQKSRQAINKAARGGKDPVVVVTGCMAKQHRESLEAQDFVTYVVENEHKTSIFPLVEAHYRKEILHPVHQTTDLFGYRSVDTSSRTRSFIKIQDGCDNLCTFCIIPFVRGLAVSRPVQDIVDNAVDVLEAGYKELVITGVNIGRYDSEGVGLDGLLSRIVALPGDFRVRISSIEPDGFTDAFFEMLEHPKVMPHLHLCLQSGSERVLRRMRRMYTAEQFMRMVERIRGRLPDFNFSTDIMVGFPGETEQDFEDSLAVCRQAAFSHIHTFK